MMTANKTMLPPTEAPTITPIGSFEFDLNSVDEGSIVVVEGREGEKTEVGIGVGKKAEVSLLEAIEYNDATVGLSATKTRRHQNPFFAEVYIKHH